MNGLPVIRCLLIGPAALAAAGIVLAPAAHAQSFTVQSGQTVGSQTMNNAGDTGIIEPGGTVNSVVLEAVRMLNNDQTLTNGGSITAAGLSTDGIVSTGANAWISNSGSIATAGDFSVGIRSAGDNAWISNSGSITTMAGDFADGIFSFGANAWISNSGSIATASATGHGIHSQGANAWISNGGSITTTGPSARGIFSNGANGQVTNYGRIVSAQSNAIEFSGAGNNILTLLPGSVLQGGLAFGGGVDTLKVGNGLSISNTFDKAPEVLNAYGAPFAVLGTRVAVVDPTTLSTQDEALADLTGGIFSTVMNRLNGLRNGVVGVTTNPRPMVVAGSKDGGAVQRGREYWIQGFGSYRDQEGGGPSLDTNQRVAGVVSGMDAHYSATTRAGFFLGGSQAKVEHVLNTQKTETDSFFGGVYVSTLRGRMAIDLAVTAGWSDYERKRVVANNLAAGGLQTARGDYDGFFISPEVTFTRPFWPMGRRVEKVVTLR